MSRLIDGDKLMMSLADWWYSSFGEDETDESKAIRKVMNKVEESLDKFIVPRWIPCSERLPTESDDYLCTYGSLSGWFVDISIYETEKKEFGFYSDNERGEEVWHPVTNVVAWMPLPDPWRAES